MQRASFFRISSLCINYRESYGAKGIWKWTKKIIHDDSEGMFGVDLNKLPKSKSTRQKTSKKSSSKEKEDTQKNIEKK